MSDRIAIYHEHPDWFRPLFAELERREVPFIKLDAGVHTYDPTERRPDFSLVFNRASPSSYLRGHLGTIFSTWSWLSHLDRIGIPVVNGSRMFTHEISKARQLNALEELAVAYPRARDQQSGRGCGGCARTAISACCEGERGRQWCRHLPV